MLKTFLIWLCLLSLPLHGMAAATMAGCGAGHPPAAVVAATSMSMHEGHHGDHHGAHHAEHHDHKASHAQTDKCSACAVCCTAHAMVAPMLQWQGASPGPSPLVAAVRVLQPSFHPEGFERPPRSSLA